jgi:DNA-binding transcriptional ArsR family regulator
MQKNKLTQPIFHDSWFDNNANILKILGHPVRLKIVHLLRQGPLCASATNTEIPISQPNLSQHLKALRQADIIDCACHGTKRCYYLCRPKLIDDIFNTLILDHQKIIFEYMLTLRLKLNVT